ncbi:MAG: SHOCT domain-containing protein [Actinobacteria bacterium]|nr:SHOCT domain-containing protein [Actinomycetota bacterium]
MWDWHVFGWGGWLLMTGVMLAFWGAIAYLALGWWRNGETASAARRDPKAILDERLARGEIGIEEHRARLEALRTPAESRG